MNIVVAVKLVPDLVEELVIDESGVALDPTWLRLILNETDDHAIEQAVLLKESGGGQVTVVALDAEGIDEPLYTAAAKGADRLIKLERSRDSDLGNYALARILANAIKTLRPDLILCGVQAHDELDGPVGPQLAEHLGLPYVGYVAGVAVSGERAMVRKDYPGGLIAEMAVALPAVLGVQASAKPPRYVPIARVRQTMRSLKIEEQAASEPESVGGPVVGRMYKPEAAERAEMIEGGVDEVATRLTEILGQLGVL